MNIIGESQTGTVINGQNINWIFNIASGVNVNIQNLTLTNGTADNGGAIYNQGNLTAENCIFNGNTATTSFFDGGGAIYNYCYDQQSSIVLNCTISKCTFTGNTVKNHVGGAIFNYCMASHDSSKLYFSVTNSTFTGNTAYYSGGAIYNYCYDVFGSSSLFCTVSNCTFNGNTATTGNGGAICSFCTDNNGFSELYSNVYGCTFNGNTATTGNGGAIFNNNAGGGDFCSFVAHFNRFYNNNANSGDAICNNGGTVDAENNWWGSNNPDFSSLIVGTSAPSQWLFMTINDTPSIINNTQTSLITVSFNNYSTDGIHYTPLPKPLAGNILDGTPVDFILINGPFGSLASNTAYTYNGVAYVLFTAASVGIQDINATADNQKVTTNVTINPASNLYLKITSNNNNPNVGQTFKVTYKLGNYGPDNSTNVTITIPLPDGFIVSNINGDGTWTYKSTTNTITWTLANVPVGDPYLYVTGWSNHAGKMVFSSSITSNNYNINTQGVTPLTINVVQAARATSTITSTRTIGMQNTGLPIAGLILAILAVMGGLVTLKRK